MTPQPDPPPPLRILRYVVPMTLVQIAYSGARVGLSLDAIHLGASGLQVGMLISLLSVLPMFLSVQVGRLSDRVGYFMPVLVSAGLATGGCVLLFFMQSLTWLFVASVAIGCGWMGVHIAMTNAVGGQATPEQRTRAYNMVALGYAMSNVAGPIVTGFAIDAFGHGWAFALLAILPATAIVIVLSVPSKARPPAAAPAVAQSHRALDLLHHPQLRWALIVSGLISMSWDMFTFVMPVEGARNGLSASVIGLIMSSFGVGTFTIRLFLSRLVRVSGEWKVLAFFMLLVALCYALLPLTQIVSLLIGLAFILGLGLGATTPIVMSLVHTAAPEGRSGEALGVRSTIMSTSQTVLPLLAGVIMSTVGAGAMFWLFALLLAVCAARVLRQQRADDAS